MTFEEALKFKDTVDHKNGYIKRGILDYKLVIVPKENKEFSDYMQDKYRYEDLEKGNSQKVCKSGKYMVVGIHFKNEEEMFKIIHQENLPLKS